jgi:hypothetical protein
MAAPLFVLIFSSVLGVLIVAYFHHFRHRTSVMGPERLKAALSRTVAGEEKASDEDLREGLLELESRLRRAIVLNAVSLAVILGTCLLLILLSTLPELALALSGLAILLICTMISLMMLRDILHPLHQHLEEGAAGE